MTSSKDRKGYWLIAGCIATVLIILAFANHFRNEPQPDSDNCVGAVAHSTVIILDHTQTITEQTRNEFLSRATEFIKSNVQEQERVTVFAVSKTSQGSLTPLVSKCRPPSEAVVGIENERIVKANFEENFEEPIRVALQEPVTDSEESPIAQAITDITLSHYLRSPRNTLLVFSDLLENSDRLSMYKCTDSRIAISEYRAAAKGGQERPTFRNTAVILNIVPRGGLSPHVLNCRRQFWQWFFGDNIGDEAHVHEDFLPG